MKSNKILIYICLLCSMCILACNSPIEYREPVGNESDKPSVVSNIRVINKEGKAQIIYDLPTSSNLMYVKAVYTINTGKEIEVKSSIYKDTIEVLGFADTKEHEVKLYAVSRNEVLSDPVVVKVQPLEAPFLKVFKSLELNNAFGGYNLTAKNPSRDNISIIVMKKNVFNEFERDNQKSIYTKTDSIVSKIRGLDTLEQEFAIYVKDNWGNNSDTIYTKVKPIFEQQMDPTKFRGFVLPGDAPQVTNGARLEYAWDGLLGWPNVSFTHQINGGNNPHMITFDMGVTAKISRFWIRPFPEGTRFYFLTTMKRFEIYGSNSPNLSGALDNSWTLLGSYEAVKPSGLPYGTDNAEDQATAGAGFNWEVDLASPRVRYIRVRCLENFAGGTAQSINEIKVYGSTL
ncbi:DUF4959 domain-containing protein [Sphingobacterium bovistauri]|uniref:DUF4959 domain-containing protein n=1 Tax=Sphingobacterium bovistauri TaxID=2781959 RepID=A0ABS7Z589_9SPHI|nr:DUF5000 domain-containing lipoprotein [Sphingobacterium bovistauri]MCA5005363.1 DUF4959 domain-containing protein [Sphingobacterium bovistauri]